MEECSKEQKIIEINLREHWWNSSGNHVKRCKLAYTKVQFTPPPLKLTTSAGTYRWHRLNPTEVTKMDPIVVYHSARNPLFNSIPINCYVSTNWSRNAPKNTDAKSHHLQGQRQPISGENLFIAKHHAIDRLLPASKRWDCHQDTQGVIFMSLNTWYISH